LVFDLLTFIILNFSFRRLITINNNNNKIIHRHHYQSV
jgi:hypothetical protein